MSLMTVGNAHYDKMYYVHSRVAWGEPIAVSCGDLPIAKITSAELGGTWFKVIDKKEYDEINNKLEKK
jgi:hypothetical protein|tara:strand:+ start:77 stop:280 length:204 start_codon:yes stop_codon:yes gene_type:complete